MSDESQVSDERLRFWSDTEFDSRTYRDASSMARELLDLRAQLAQRDAVAAADAALFDLCAGPPRPPTDDFCVPAESYVRALIACRAARQAQGVGNNPESPDGSPSLAAPECQRADHKAAVELADECCDLVPSGARASTISVIGPAGVWSTYDMREWPRLDAYRQFGTTKREGGEAERLAKLAHDETNCVDGWHEMLQGYRDNEIKKAGIIMAALSKAGWKS